MLERCMPKTSVVVCQIQTFFALVVVCKLQEQQFNPAQPVQALIRHYAKHLQYSWLLPAALLLVRSWACYILAIKVDGRSHSWAMEKTEELWDTINSDKHQFDNFKYCYQNIRDNAYGISGVILTKLISIHFKRILGTIKLWQTLVWQTKLPKHQRQWMHKGCHLD